MNNKNEIANFGIVSACGCEPDCHILVAINEENRKQTTSIRGRGDQVLAMLAVIVNHIKDDYPHFLIMRALAAGLENTDGDDNDED